MKKYLPDLVFYRADGLDLKKRKKGKYERINTHLILLFVERRNLKKNKGKYNEKYLLILHCIG